MKIKKFRTLFTFILFAFLGICKIAAQGSTAPSHNCGVFQKLGGIPDGYGGQIYYDRFGNAWSEEEIANLGSNLQDECNAGVFKLSFSGTYSTEERDQVCAALTYLSGQVNGVTPGTVPLKIEFVNNVDGNGAAASSFMELECGLLKNLPLVNIRTNFNKLPLGFFAGLIQIDTDPDWYTEPVVPILADWNNLIGKVDLFTVALHEGMHLLGVASTFGGVELNGGNVVQGFFTDWDRYLYDRNGTDYIKLIEIANDPDCCSKHIKNPNAPNTFPGDCTVDIVFRDGTNDLAEVSYNGLNPIDAGQLNNRLSHLDIDCGPGFQYVMHPGAPPSPALFSYPRRDITFKEREILCSIGYQSVGCEKCVIVANDDYIPTIFFLNSTPPSNPIRLNTGLSGTPSDGIPGTGISLWTNDVFPAGSLMELCGHDPEITVVPIYDTQTGLNIVRIDVYGINTPGNYEFCYRLKGCSDAVCDEATVHVTVLENVVATFCDTDDCNLVCFGDFEGFPVTGGDSYYPSLDLPEFYFDDLSDLPHNTPDIHLQTDVDPPNQVVRWARSTHVGQHQESLRIPLSEPLYEGCTATVHYQAAVAELSGPIPDMSTIRMEVYGLTGPPCPVIATQPLWPGIGLSNQLCSGVTAYGMQQNANLFFDVDVSGPPQNTVNLDLADYTFTYTHPAGAPPITDLLIWGTFTPSDPPPFGTEGVEFYMDNLTVTSSCITQIQVTPTVISQCIGGQAVIQYEVCLLGSGINFVMVDLQAVIPPTGLTVVPGGGFDENGMAALQLIPGTVCNGGANTSIVTLTIDVSPNFTPINVEILMNLVGTGLCIDPAIGDGGDVTLMLQDCVPAAVCHCPPGTGYERGVNMDSQTDLSTSGLPLLLENTCLALSGRLYVDQNFTIKNTEIIMNRGAEIVVKEKPILKLEGNQIHGCQEMWRGITVLGRLEAEGNEIKDAQWAIRSENKSTITVTDNDFKQNFTAFYAPDVPTGGNAVNTIKISGNEVICTVPLLPAYTVLGNPDHQQVPAPGERTFAAAYLNDVEKNSFSFQKNNVFDGIRNGVVANNSMFSMDRCTIKNLVTCLYPQGQAPGGDFNNCLYGVRAADCPNITITNCNISGVHRGVQAARSNLTVNNANIIDADVPFSPSESASTIPTAIKADFGTNRSATITGNTLTSCGHGIDLNQWQPASKLLVYDNDITLSTCNISFNSSGISMGFCTKGEVSANTVKPLTPSNGKGLSLSNSNNIFVNGNTFYDLFKGESGENNIGCYFLGNTAKSDIGNGSPAGTASLGFINTFSDNPYCCNTVDGLSSIGFTFDGPSTGTSFKYSQIHGQPLGLLLTESADISPQTHAKNRWFAVNAGAFHSSDDPQFIFQSIFICEPALIPPFATAADQPGMPGVPWFSQQTLPPGPVQPLCNCAYPQSGGDLPRVTPDGDSLAAISGYQVGQYTDSYNWMTRQRLYERLRQAPQLANASTQIAAFYQAAGSTAIGQFNAVKQGIWDLIGRDDFSREVIGQSIDQINGLSEELRLLRIDPASTELQQRIKAHQLYQEAERYKSYIKAVEQQQAYEIGTLLDANASLSASTVAQANEKTFNRVILENRFWEGGSIIAVDTNALHLIAVQCPLSGGFSVYQARGVLTALGSTQNWESVNPCAPVDNRSNKGGEKPVLSRLSIYPNPANQLLTVSGFVPNDHEKTFEIYTTTGQKVVQAIVKANQTSIDINIAGLKDGLYLYRSNAPNQPASVGKIVVLH